MVRVRAKGVSQPSKLQGPAWCQAQKRRPIDVCRLSEKITTVIICHNVSAHKTSKSIQSRGDGKWFCVGENMNPGLLVLLPRPLDASFSNKSYETLGFRNMVFFLDGEAASDLFGTCVLFFLKVWCHHFLFSPLFPDTLMLICFSFSYLVCVVLLV